MDGVIPRNIRKHKLNPVFILKKETEDAKWEIWEELQGGVNMIKYMYKILKELIGYYIKMNVLDVL